MKLPNSEDLNREQMQIFFATLEGDIFVGGPPGTGKTVMALYRAQMVSSKYPGVKFWLIMYTRVLKKYTEDNLGKGNFQYADKVQKRIRTMNAWAWAWGKNWGWGHPPEIERYVFDWNEVYSRLLAKDPSIQKRAANWGHLLIDEGQDFPPEFYRVLNLTKGLGGKIGKSMSLTVFADENQKITQYNSSVSEIKNELSVGDEACKMLTQNYRNSLEIAKLASTFYVGLQSGIPDFPKRKGLADPELFACKNVQEEVDLIVNFMRLNDDRTVGVFVETHKVREPLYDALKKSKFDGSDIKVQTFVNDDEEFNTDKLELEKPGSITVICAASCKGLEFDAVFIPRLETYPMDPAATDVFKMGMYVKISRARDYLYLSYTSSSGQRPAILKYFPPELQGDSSVDWIEQPPKLTPQSQSPTVGETISIGGLELQEYGKGLLLTGNTFELKDEIKRLGGKWIKKGWIFWGDKKDELISFMKKQI
jgi:DNA helicase II / ATP-dependent DNA helicase PcrA